MNTLQAIVGMGCCAGFLSSWLFVQKVLVWRRRRERRTRMMDGLATTERRTSPQQGFGVRLMERQSHEAGLGMASWMNRLPQVRAAGTKQAITQAGLQATISVAGVMRARYLLGGGLGCLSALCGLLVTVQMGAALGAVGLAVGWVFPLRCLKNLRVQRRYLLEQHLSEALEVICLGLRSGLNFDAALGLYCREFDSVLAYELQEGRMRWTMGIQTREQVLKALAATYDSALMDRVVDNVVRALRFGSSLADGLELIAAEARQTHRAQVEERVMKAPVKMMVPVGTLILPSMLLLVMGPVLLELMEGF